MALRGTLTHRKTRRLATLLNIMPCMAMGIMEALWHVTSEQAPCGDIGKLSNQDIADEMFYTGDADHLIDCLLKAGILDEHLSCRLSVHSWEDHADQATKRKVARFGKAIVRGEQSQLDMTSQSLDMTSLPVSSVPYPESISETPNKTEMFGEVVPFVAKATAQNSRSAQKPSSEAEALWSEFLEHYPKRGRGGDLRKSEGKKRFIRLLQQGTPAQAILSGVKEYRAWADANGKTGTEFIKMIPTWLNGECWLESWEVSSDPGNAINTAKRPPKPTLTEEEKAADCYYEWFNGAWMLRRPAPLPEEESA